MLQVRSNRTLGARLHGVRRGADFKDEADALRDADAGAKEAREAERASGGDANAPTSATKRSRAVSATKRPKFSVHDHLLGPNGLAVV